MNSTKNLFSEKEKKIEREMGGGGRKRNKNVDGKSFFLISKI